MLVYRYENADGGGPWFYKDGSVRQPLPDWTLYLDIDDYVYGCDSLKSLFQYFSEQRVNVNGCTLKTYDIPKEDIIFLNGQVKFPKKYIK
jgi:hypothetical protein